MYQFDQTIFNRTFYCTKERKISRT